MKGLISSLKTGRKPTVAERKVISSSPQGEHLEDYLVSKILSVEGGGTVYVVVERGSNKETLVEIAKNL